MADGCNLASFSVGQFGADSLLHMGFTGDRAAVVDHDDELGQVVIRLGLCCMFQEQPIKFVTTTATAIGRMNRLDALAKLSRLCLQNADALLAALRYCAGNNIGCFRVNSQILPVKTHPTSGYGIEELPDGQEIIRGFKECGKFAEQAPTSNLLSSRSVCGPEFATS